MWKAVSTALEKYSRGEIKPLYGGKWSPPYKVEIWVMDTLFADMAQLIPGIERKDAYLLSYNASSAWDVLRIVELVAWIGGSASYMTQAMRG
jgi:D-aminopeptidase